MKFQLYKVFKCSVKFNCVLRNIIVLVDSSKISSEYSIITIVFINLIKLRQSVSSNEMS